MVADQWSFLPCPMAAVLQSLCSTKCKWQSIGIFAAIRLIETQFITTHSGIFQPGPSIHPSTYPVQGCGRAKVRWTGRTLVRQSFIHIYKK